MKYKLQDLIDIDHFQNLQDRLNEIYSFPSAIIDNDGNILTATAWQDLCTQFHRKNKETEKLCIKSDQYIQDHIHEANPAVSYRCPHGLVDNATPIIIDGIHYGNFFTGQFFLEKPDLEFFRAQAHQYGFEETSYLEAVRKVPLWTQEQLDNYLFFIKGLIAVISESGLKTLQEVENRTQMEAREKRHKSILKTAMDGYWLVDSTGRLLEVNDTYCHMSGYSEDDLLTKRISDLDAVENLKVVIQRIEKIISEGSDRFETKHRRKDGTVFDVEISVQYRPEEEGIFVCFLRDITDRKQSEDLQHIQHDLSYKLIDADNLEQGLEICLDASLKASNIEAGGIYLINEVTGGVDLVHHKGLPEEFVDEVRHFEADSENVTLLREKRPIYTEYPKLNLPQQESEKAADFKVICIIPLTFQDNLIGYINLTSSKQKTISGFSRVAVETIANQIGSWVNYNRTKKTLDKTEQRFSLAMEAAQDGMYDWNLIENTIYYSPGWKRMLGYTDSELPNDFSIWEKLTNPQDVQRSWKMLNELITTKRDRFEIEFKMKHKDGHWVDILSRATALFNNNGTAMRLVGTHVDITERKQAEKRLRDVLQFNEKIISESPVGITIYEADSGRCIAANSAITKLIGGTREEILRQNFYKIESWKKSGLLATAKEVIEKKISKRKTLDVTSSFGKTIAIDCHLSQFSFSEKQHLLLTATDVTQKLEDEKTILRQRETAERYLNLAGVMFIGLDKDGNINLANKKACQILDVQQEEVLGKNWFDTFIPQNIRHEVYPVFQRIIGGDTELSEYHENSVVSKTGKEKHIAWHNTAIHNEEGNIVGLLSSGEDITEKKQLLSKLQQAQKMESIGTLAGGIAHDFNNILSSVIGFTELALDAVDKKTPIAEDLHEVYSAGLRAKDLVKQILTFARQSDEKLTPIQVDIIIKEVLKFIRSSIPATIEIKQDIKSDSLIMGNSTQIHRIMMNLCTNAAHAMENEGGTLEVTLKDITIDRAVRIGTSHLQSGHYIEIKVSDTGDGIDPQVIDKIFEPYFTTKKHGEGTGMGLAMVHGIVETYGGNIFAESSLGKGTVFTLYLPVARAGKAHQQYKVEELPTGQERVLFIDDEAQIAKLGSQILGQLGYSVTSMTNSLEALELFQTKPNDFDLVISDVTMPGMTGDVLAQKLMQIRQNIPVILSTGYSKKVSEETASEIGVKAFIVKPFVKKDLAKTVRKVLDTDEMIEVDKG